MFSVRGDHLSVSVRGDHLSVSVRGDHLCSVLEELIYVQC